MREKLEKIGKQIVVCMLRQASTEQRVNELETALRDAQIMILHLKKIPQVQIAKIVNLSPGRVSQIIKNYAEPTLSEVEKNEEK